MDRKQIVMALREELNGLRVESVRVASAIAALDNTAQGWQPGTTRELPVSGVNLVATPKLATPAPRNKPYRGAQGKTWAKIRRDDVLRAIGRTPLTMGQILDRIGAQRKFKNRNSYQASVNSKLVSLMDMGKIRRTNRAGQPISYSL